MATQQYKVIDKGFISASSGNMMNQHYTTIETIDGKHSYDILSRTASKLNKGDFIKMDLSKISPWDKHQLS